MNLNNIKFNLNYMKTENMKLLDLQTGKYLEVGEGFYYGGDHIIVNKCNVGYQIYEAIQHKDSERLSIDNKDCPFAAEPPLPLKEICEKVGAVVCGGRYVLLNGEQDTWLHDDNHFYKIGDVVFDDNYNRYGCVAICKSSTEYACYENVVDIPEFIHNCEAGLMYRKYEILGNIFEEYSKQLRNEPNKFDELSELLK